LNQGTLRKLPLGVLAPSTKHAGAVRRAVEAKADASKSGCESCDRLDNIDVVKRDKSQRRLCLSFDDSRASSRILSPGLNNKDGKDVSAVAESWQRP